MSFHAVSLAAIMRLTQWELQVVSESCTEYVQSSSEKELFEREKLSFIYNFSVRRSRFTANLRKRPYAKPSVPCAEPYSMRLPTTRLKQVYFLNRAHQARGNHRCHKAQSRSRKIGSGLTGAGVGRRASPAARLPRFSRVRRERGHRDNRGAEESLAVQGAHPTRLSGCRPGAGA